MRKLHIDDVPAPTGVVSERKSNTDEIEKQLLVAGKQKNNIT